MFQKLFCFFFLAFLLGEIYGHTYHLGSCPAIEPVTDFNINRMLGIWYVIQKTSTASICITYNFTELEEPHRYNLEEVSQHFILGLTPLQHEYHTTGELSTPDPSVPGKMEVNFPLNVIGKASYTVFMTDYDNYAGIYTCQGLGLGHRQSASILSRKPTLDKVYIDKLRTRLSSYNVDPFEFSIISQTGCPKNENESERVNVDDETDSTIIEDVTEYSYEITYGLNTDVESNGKTPDLLQDGSTESSQIVNLDSRLKPKEDAEWLR